MSVFVKINSFCKIFDLNGKILPCFKRKHHESMPWTCYFPNIIVTCIILLIGCNNQFRNYKPIFRRKQSSLICYIFLLKFRIGGFEIACWIRWARHFPWIKNKISNHSSNSLTVHAETVRYLPCRLSRSQKRSFHLRLHLFSMRPCQNPEAAVEILHFWSYKL